MKPREVIFKSWWSCPRCGCEPDRDYVRYCSNCGQRLLWNKFYNQVMFEENFGSHLHYKVEEIIRYFNKHHNLNNKHKKFFQIITIGLFCEECYLEVAQHIFQKNNITCTKICKPTNNYKFRTYIKLNNKIVCWFQTEEQY